MKQTGPVAFGFVVGMVMLLQYFIPHPVFLKLYNWILDWKQVVLGMTFILGTVSLVTYHVRRLEGRSEGWFYSLVALLGLAVISIVGFLGVTRIVPAWDIDGGPYIWIFDHIQAPMQATMFSLLAFFVASASYRSFRVRSFQAFLLLLAGVIVMLGRVPIGEKLTIGLADGSSFGLPQIADWILKVPNLAAKRGIILGVGLGMTATALKIILGIERTYLGRGG
jgi:hypothetical protein